MRCELMSTFRVCACMWLVGLATSGHNLTHTKPTLIGICISINRFPWLQKLEENAAVVQQELKEAMQMGEMLEKTGNNVWIGALTAEGAAYGPDWKVRGERGASCRVGFSSRGRRALATSGSCIIPKIPVRSLNRRWFSTTAPSI